MGLVHHKDLTPLCSPAYLVLQELCSWPLSGHSTFIQVQVCKLGKGRGEAGGAHGAGFSAYGTVPYLALVLPAVIASFSEHPNLSLTVPRRIGPWVPCINVPGL